jgi:hypothetical protein
VWKRRGGDSAHYHIRNLVLVEFIPWKQNAINVCGVYMKAMKLKAVSTRPLSCIETRSIA